MSNNKAGANNGGGSCLSEIQRLQRVGQFFLPVQIMLKIILCLLLRSEKKDVGIWNRLR